MAGREVEIHRGRLDNEILADRAQLLTQLLSKKIFKNFEKYRKTFSFFWMEILNIFEKSPLFSSSKKKIEGHFRRIRNEKVEIFRKFSKCQSKKMKMFFEIFQNF